MHPFVWEETQDAPDPVHSGSLRLQRSRPRPEHAEPNHLKYHALLGDNGRYWMLNLSLSGHYETSEALPKFLNISFATTAETWFSYPLSAIFRSRAIFLPRRHGRAR
jgi:hypothetical protein